MKRMLIAFVVILFAANVAQAGEGVCYYKGDKYSEGALIVSDSGEQQKCDCDSEGNCRWI